MYYVSCLPLISGLLIKKLTNFSLRLFRPKLTNYTYTRVSLVCSPVSQVYATVSPGPKGGLPVTVEAIALEEAHVTTLDMSLQPSASISRLKLG